MFAIRSTDCVPGSAGDEEGKLQFYDARHRPPPPRDRRVGRTVAAALLVLGAHALPASAQDGPQRLPAVRLNAGIHNIEAEVARTPEQRATGLMFRRALGANEGMLFVFEQPGTQCFWMKNTLLPLSIAFLQDDGTVVNIEDMAPQSLDSHCSTKPVRLALEMNQGWFRKRGVDAGSALKGPVFEKPAPRTQNR